MYSVFETILLLWVLDSIFLDGSVMKRGNQLLKNPKGFTLIELLIVIAIIGIILSVVFGGNKSEDPALTHDEQVQQRIEELNRKKAKATNEPEKSSSDLSEFIDPDCVRKYGEFACKK